MSAADQAPNPATSPGESTTSTRQPSQLLVLLAGAGTPPLDVEQTRRCPINLFDAFVLAPDRSRLFYGAPGALFPPRTGAYDPRHDPLARIVRHVTMLLRSRLESHEVAEPALDLVRYVERLAPARIEALLAGLDSRTGAPVSLNAPTVLGRLEPNVDALASDDAGVLRRVLALVARGLQVDRSKRPRGGSVVNDLGGLALMLGLVDMAANPLSALRAARRRLAKAGRLDAHEIAHVRDVGQGLRELLSQAVAAATSAGAAGRELVKETVLPPEMMDHLAVGLARTVYDGLGPEHERPLVVPGIADNDAFTAAPILVRSRLDEAHADPTVGLYNRIAFLALPYARRSAAEPFRPSLTSEPPPRLPRSLALTDAAMSRAREIVRNVPPYVPVGPALFYSLVDTLEGRHAWRPVAIDTLPRQIVRSVDDGAPGIHTVIVVGTRTDTSRTLVNALATAMSASSDWHVLAPRATDRTLVFDPLPADDSTPDVLRRADLTRWLEPAMLQTVHWELPASARVALNLLSYDDLTGRPLESLFALLGDADLRVHCRGMLVLLGAPTYAHAAVLLNALARQSDLEGGALPLRSHATWLVRTDVPLPARREWAAGGDDAALAAVVEGVAPGAPWNDHVLRAMLAPPEAKFRSRLVRMAAALTASTPSLLDARRGLERAAVEPTNGSAMRRALQAGIAAQWTVRSAAQAGLGAEIVRCVQHELTMLLAEWDDTRARPNSARIADVLRGALCDSVFQAHPRAAIVLGETVADSLPASASDFVERIGGAQSAPTVAGVRAGGTLYARDAAREVIPLAFALRGGAVELHVLFDVQVGASTARAPTGGHVAITWRPAAGQALPIAIAAPLASAAHDVVRRWNPQGPMRLSVVDGRQSCAMWMELTATDATILEQVCMILPLRSGVNDRDVAAVTAELVARLFGASGSDSVTEWAIQAASEEGRALAMPTGVILSLRDAHRRWFRALRAAARVFPGDAGDNDRYDEQSMFPTAAEIGLPSALLRDKQGSERDALQRLVVSRVAAHASSLMPRVKELGARMPLKKAALEGDDGAVLERVLVVAWFLYDNFCTMRAGALEWSPPGFNDGQAFVERNVERSRLKVWLQRKSEKPDVVKSRVEALTNYFEPTIVIG